MNWTKTLLAGVVAGIVRNLSDFVMHGMILGPTYQRYPAFEQEPANPGWFFAVAVCIGLMTALLFAMSRASWAAGVAGGVKFGLLVGLVAFFPSFYNPLVIAGFPYFLAWCWGGINVIGYVLMGATLGALIKR
jgi:hypothetical protein